jgi:hypothetical protein
MTTHLYPVTWRDQLQYIFIKMQNWKIYVTWTSILWLKNDDTCSAERSGLVVANPVSKIYLWCYNWLQRNSPIFVIYVGGCNLLIYLLRRCGYLNYCYLRNISILILYPHLYLFLTSTVYHSGFAPKIFPAIFVIKRRYTRMYTSM